MSLQYFTPGEGNRPLINDEPKTLLKKIANSLYNLNGSIGSYYTQAQVNAIIAALADSDPLSVSTAGTTQITIDSNVKHYVLDLAAAAGAGAYTRTIDLEGTNRLNGDIAEVLITFAASANPLIDVRDGVSDISLIGGGQAGTGSVFTSLVRCFFNGTNWKLLSWS